MKKIAQFIVKHRMIFVATFAILAVVGIVGSIFVKQNYDMSKYLSADTDTARSIAIMKEEFGLSNNLLLMVTLDESSAEEEKNILSGVEGVALVSLDSYKNGKALYIVALNGDEYSAESKETVKRLKNKLESQGADYVISGNVEANSGIISALGAEIPIIMIIAIVIIFLVLIITSHSWIEPIVIGLSLLCSVLINMGSNIIFGEISYVTFAVSAILQIALAMDYSIILLHGYTERKESGLTKEDAIVEALAANMRPISSSGLTTIAGLIALLFMSFTIGFDIGMVLAKGILVSLLCVMLFMPALIMIFSKPLEKTKHKPVPLGGSGIAKASISLKSVLPIILIVIIIGSFILQMSNVYTFTGWSSSNGQEKIAENFGNTNQIVVLIDNDYADDDAAHKGFVNSIESLQNENGNPALKSIASWPTLELNPKTITDNINLDLDEFMSIIKAILGEDFKVSDLVKIWEDCGGDVYEIEITKKTLAVLMDKKETDAILVTVYDALSGGKGKVTIGSMIDKYNEFKNNILLKWIANMVPDNAQKILQILDNNREDITESARLIVPQLINDWISEYGLDAEIYDIELQTDNIGKSVCNVLFDSDNFKAFEFYQMWDDCDNDILEFKVTDNMLARALGMPNLSGVLKFIMSAISEDGNVTVGALIAFARENRDSPLIKEIINDKIIGACIIADIMKDYYVPTLNNSITLMLKALRSNFVGSEHSRIILTMDIAQDGKFTFEVLNSVKTFAGDNFGKDNLIAGESVIVKDISEAFSDDLLKINLVTVIAILLIIAVLFRSVTLPIILVFVIQGAIWITLAIYAVFDIPIFFMSYIICICIQMGATIDYGILIASSYRRNRAVMQKTDAIVQSLKTAMPTIVTSGLILIISSFIVGFVSSVMPIYSIGKLLGLGTVVSVLLILFLLPALLYIFDKAISFTTWDGVKPVGGEESSHKKHIKM